MLDVRRIWRCMTAEQAHSGKAGDASMSMFSWLGEVFGAWRQSTSSASTAAAHVELFGAVNPAAGLPMMGPGTGGVDVAGNPYGVDLAEVHHTGGDHHSDAFAHDHRIWTDPFGGCSGVGGSDHSTPSWHDDRWSGSSFGGAHGTDW